MPVKSKLKMALVAEKGTDFGRNHLKKKEKAARKAKSEKEEVKKVAQEDWEDVESEGENAEDSEDEGNGPTNIDFAGIDESDSDSEIGSEPEDDDDDDDEDIPMSDLEDLSEEEKEDLVPHQRLTINNTVALTAALKRISLPLSKMTFSEHQCITTAEPVAIADVSDDLSRELAFYAQSLSAANEARKLLKSEGVAFTRPTDYFAEMVKADEHMAKIKAKLIDEAAGKKASAEARKQRDLKKFGKQVQVAKQQERDKERKDTMDKIKVLKRKRQGAETTSTNEADLFDVALEDETKDSKRTGKDGKPHKRQKRDEKYGHGGKKRFSKSGDAQSSGDLTGFSSKKMKGVVKSSGGAKKRPGKARRAGGKH